MTLGRLDIKKICAAATSQDDPCGRVLLAHSLTAKTLTLGSTGKIDKIYSCGGVPRSIVACGQ